MLHSDIIIIGSGPGGYKAAEYAAKNGLSVTLFEQSELGGTCLNTGCIPTKTFCRHAAVLRDMQHADTFGIKNLSYEFQFSAVQQRKQGVVEQLRQGVATLLAAPGITIVRERASFADTHTVVAGGKEYSAQHIIIATGSSPKLLPIKGAELEGVLTSSEMLSIDHVPRRQIQTQPNGLFHRKLSPFSLLFFSLPPFAVRAPNGTNCVRTSFDVRCSC